jgi:hypothetical protein
MKGVSGDLRVDGKGVLDTRVWSFSFGGVGNMDGQY